MVDRDGRDGAVVGKGAEDDAVLRAVDALSDSQLAWFQSSGPFRHVCRAAIARRQARGSWTLREGDTVKRLPLDLCLVDNEALVEALRAVQYEESRALIALSPALRDRIETLIGKHPRDGGEP